MTWNDCQRDKKRKEAHEKELKNSLSEKLKQYEQSTVEPDDDFTVLKIEDKEYLVPKLETTAFGT